MLSSVTLNCQVTKIGMSLGSELSELQCLKGHKCLRLFLKGVEVGRPFLVRLCLPITLIKRLKGHNSLGWLFEGVL